MDGYTLTRSWFDFAFITTECKVYHTALYLWIVELNNRLGWKSEFGLPTHDTMEGLGIGNKTTYLTTLKSLEKWGFIKIVKESKNQYQACIIKLCCNKKVIAKQAILDKVLLQKRSGTGVSIEFSTGLSIVPIDKPINKETSKQYIDFDDFWKKYEKSRGKANTLVVWNKLSDQEKIFAFKYLDEYKLSQPDKKFRKDPERYLKGKLWNDAEIDLGIETVEPVEIDYYAQMGEYLRPKPLEN